MKRIALITALLTFGLAPVHAVDIPLTCANVKNYGLRVTTVIKGCLEDEISLGEGPLPISNSAKNSLDPTLENRFRAAQAAASKEGVILRISSGFRTYSRQEYLFSRAVKKYGSYFKAAKWVAPPDISHHPKGLAIDVNYPNEPESAQWLEINGYKFGLCRIFKNEWWHFEANIAPGWKCPKMYKDARALLNS